ncbi:replication initiator [Nocardia tengchongensis]|uniref:replication initiator n=1 Tax=Nocardia tengchongensis TaxID=2055889 RepID=UPI00340DAFBF
MTTLETGGLSLLEMAIAAADESGVCRRPIAMRVENPATGDIRYVPAPCGNTLESQCPACAKRKRAMRIQQCREGWHLDTEPVIPESELNKGEDAETEEDAELEGGRRRRSTRRRQDAPNLPRRKVENRTVGEVFAGQYQPGMFLTLTMPSYGKVYNDGAVNRKGEVCGDGSPIDPDGYDYRQAARDCIHFSRLFSRWVQNLRRAVGWKVQYFATVEPQRRGAPHVHLLIRGRVEKEMLRQVTAATYHQVWWPHHDVEVYGAGRMPVWDYDAKTFVDPQSRIPLPGWEQARDVLDEVDELDPAHVIRFGPQIKPKGILKGTPKADAAIGYLAKYLTKSVAEILEPPNQRTAEHYDRLHAELLRTPCSDRCPVWLRYGIVPKGVGPKTHPGYCRGHAHQRDWLGVAGDRQKVSELWTGKTMADYAAERRDFVRELLDGAGIEQPDTSRLIVTVVEPGDPAVPPREHLILGAIAQRTAWRIEYQRVLATLGPPEAQEDSADVYKVGEAE